MKIISLNTWGGRAGKENLLAFFDAHKNDIDIFCLQEIWSAPYKDFGGHLAGGLPIDHGQIMTQGRQEIGELFPNHRKYFHPHFMDNYGLMMLVSNKFKVIAEGELFVYKEKGHIPEGDIGGHARNIQYVTLLVNNNPVTVINFHGLWNGKGKTDTEDRMKQSENIINFIKSIEGECILCGDFNLLPDTQSIKIFESNGLRNLINEHDIKSTRSSLYKKPGRYADYAFISNNLKLNSFQILPDEVSDHLAMFLDVE